MGRESDDKTNGSSGEMNKDRKQAMITKRRQPLAVMPPVQPPDKSLSIVGAMRGSVLAYHDPFRPATNPSDWSAAE